MSETSAAAVYEFGPFRYDSRQHLLFRGEALLPLLPKVADTLQALLEHAGQVVDKAELMKLVWPDCVVEDVGLARNISLLRKALGDSDGAIIETIAKRGYRFVADVRVIDGVPLEDSRSAPIARPGTLKWQCNPRLWLAAAGLVALLGLIKWQFYSPSRYLAQGALRYAELAIVPLECLGTELQRSTFSEGFNDVLVAEISKLDSVHVVSPSTVRHYQNGRIPVAVMARMLNLHAVLEGSAERFGANLRVTVRLSDVHSGKLIWAASYERPAGDIASVERELAASIASELRLRLGARTRASVDR